MNMGWKIIIGIGIVAVLAVAFMVAKFVKMDAKDEADDIDKLAKK